MGTIEINGTGGIIEGNLGAANVNVNLDSVLEFDGVNDKIIVPDDNSLDIVGDITLSAWVKITLGESDFKTIIAKAASVDNRLSPWQLRLDNSDKVEFVTGDGSSAVRVSSTNAIKEGWNHIAVTVDENGSSSVVKYFINGVLDRTVSSGWVDYSGYTNTTDLEIGILSSNYEYDGYLADVRIYNAVVSDADVAILASRINVDPSLTTAGTTNLQGWWKLNNNSITDSSPNSNDGTASGPTERFDQFHVDVYDNSTTTDGTFTVTQGKVEGKALTSLNFDGTNDRAGLGNGLTVFDGATQGAFSAWVKRDTTGSSHTIISHYDSNDSSRQFIFLVNGSDKAELNVQNDASSFNSDHVVSGTTTISANEWYHIVGTFSTTNGQKIYVNGVHEATAATTIEDALDTVASQANIASFEQGGSYSNYLDGNIRDLRLYTQELSANQVASLYSNTLPITPEHNWKFDDSIVGTEITTVADTGTGTAIDASMAGFFRYTGLASDSSSNWINGTLDLDFDLVIAANGTLSAPRGTVSLVRNFQNSGTFIHNSGTFESVSGDNTLINTSGTAPITFHNFTYSGGAFTQIYRDTTVENALTISTGHFKLNNSSNAVTLTIGTTSAAGSIVNNGTLSVDNSGTNKPTVQGASNLFPAVCTGTDWDWNANSAADWKLANLDYQIALVTGSGSASEKITLTGDCEFDAVTVSSGYTFDLNGQRAEFGGLLNVDGAMDYDGLVFLHDGIDHDGTGSNETSGKLIFATNTTNCDTSSENFDLIMINHPSFATSFVGSRMATNMLIGCGEYRLAGGTSNPTNLTIATGGELDDRSSGGTVNVAGDFTTSGGLIGKSALTFDETAQSNKVAIPDDSTLDLTTAGTLMAWVKIPTDAGAKQRIISKTFRAYEMSVESGRLAAYFGTDGAGSFNAIFTPASVDYRDGKWHHFAITLDGSSSLVKLYVDGKLVHEESSAVNFQNKSSDLSIGFRSDGTTTSDDSWMDGEIAVASVWNNVLTEAQIRSKIFSDFASLDSNTGCVAFYQFDEGSGTAVADSTSNNNDGTASSSSLWVGSGTLSSVSTSTLTMSGSNKFINYNGGNLDIGNLNVTGTITLKDIDGGGSSLRITGDTFTCGSGATLSSDTTEILRFMNGMDAGTVTFADPATNVVGLDKIFNEMTSPRSLNIPEMTAFFFRNNGTGTTVATGNHTFTQELEINNGIYNANTNTIACKAVDLNAGTLDLRNSTMNFSLTTDGDNINLASGSTLLTGNTTLTGNTSSQTSAIIPSAGNFEVVGDVSHFFMLSGSDLTVIGSVSNNTFQDSTANIRQWHHTLDTQQLLDADEAGDDDLRLTKPALDNALELMTK